MSERYASSWNAFLFENKLGLGKPNVLFFYTQIFLKQRNKTNAIGLGPVDTGRQRRPEIGFMSLEMESMVNKLKMYTADNDDTDKE